MNYEQFVASKHAISNIAGIEPSSIDGRLFHYQMDLVRWSLRRGRAALFCDTGTGKTFMGAEWCRHIAQRGRVLVLTPLAVAEQFVREAARIDVQMSYRRKDAGDAITVTNYEMLDHFDPDSFTGVLLDESSILKAFTGATRNALISAFAKTPYRLCATATPAPNDFTELGNHSEFLGIKTRVEMLAEYFVHDMETTQEWRLKGHAVEPFWRWVCSWGALVKRPSDLGYSDEGFELPPLRMHEHVIEVDDSHARAQGLLFAQDVKSLSEQRATRRSSMSDRVAKAAELVADDEPAIIWGELNDECDAIERALDGESVAHVRGNDSPDEKTEKLLGFADGRYRVLITKPAIACMGLNLQRCAKQVFLGASHSYEQTSRRLHRSV